MSLTNIFSKHEDKLEALLSKHEHIEESFSDVLIERRFQANYVIAYQEIYKARYDEPVPEGEEAREACLFRSIAEDDHKGVRQGDGITKEEFEAYLENVEEHASRFGRYLLHHDEFTTWIAHDISEYGLKGQLLEAALTSKLKHQFRDLIDVQAFLEILEVAIAAPTQFEPGLIASFQPDVPPAFLLPQLQRAHAWATKLLQEFFVQAKPDRPTIPSDPWEELLLNGFTVKDLDNLLFKLGFLDSGSNQLISRPKARFWVGVTEALRMRKFLDTSNKSAIHRALISCYGKKIVSERALQRAYESPTDSSVSYLNQALQFLSSK